jgi:hypothetical protein
VTSPNSRALSTSAIRVTLAGCAGVASLGGLELSGILDLAALDGGQELPPLVAYGVPIVSAVLLPIVLAHRLRPDGRWRGITVGLGSALGGGSGVAAAFLTGAVPPGSVAWIFGMSALGAWAGTFAWLPLSSARTAG